MEVAIPFASLGQIMPQAPGAGTVWRGNFCRQDLTGHELSFWNPSFGDFHQTQRFGQLLFQ